MRTVEVSPLVTKSKLLGFIPVEYENTLKYVCGDQLLEFSLKSGEIEIGETGSDEKTVIGTMEWAGHPRGGIERFVGTITGEGYKLVVAKPWIRPKTISLFHGDKAEVTLTLGRLSTQHSTDEGVLAVCASMRAAEVSCAEEILMPGLIATALIYSYMFEVLFYQTSG